MNKPQKTTLDPAIVLRTTVVRESDVIVTLLTGALGKISAIARGAKRSKRRFPGGIDIFDCAECELQSPRGSSHLFTLLSRGPRQAWLTIRHDLGKFRVASFCLEAADLFAPEGDHEGSLLYTPLVSSLQQINNALTQDLYYIAATRFAVKLLTASGVGPIDGGLITRDDVRDWWILLQQHDEITVEAPSSLVSEAFFLLFGYVEQIVGHRLKTHSNFYLSPHQEVFPSDESRSKRGVR